MSRTEAENFDLNACDGEPIRTPGGIQPHGFLLILGPDHHILQVSDNLGRHIGRNPDEVLGKSLATAVGPAACDAVVAALKRVGPRPQAAYLCQIIAGDGRRFDVLAHAVGATTVLEFESTDDLSADFRQLYPLIGDFMSTLSDADSIEALSNCAARAIRDVTGFGRVLVYRFDEEGHGHVTGESLEDGYHSYLGQRFPASDIPKQARDLYLSTRVRLICDANYLPSRLVPERDPRSGQPNDLSGAALRSVSPIHLEYMRNMGTLASMSFSLVSKGRLWGLISCHNAAPRFVPHDVRVACEQLGQVLMLRIESREEAADYEYRLELRRIMVAILAGLSQAPDFVDSLRSVAPDLLRFARASGAALMFEGGLTCFGDTPDEAQMLALVSWLGANSHGEVFHTECLSEVYPAAEDFKHSASGLLAVAVSRIHNHYLMWFRPEITRAIEWAGNPYEKLGRDGPVQLSPRTSFEAWLEIVHGRSAPWRAGEIEMAAEFRAALLGIVLERAEQMVELAEELGRVNKELEAFSYSVSHDLRAPLRHIVGFSDLLLESDGTMDATKQNRFLRNIKESAQFAGKLVDGLLNFSQMGKAALRPLSLDMAEVVQSCREKLAMEIGQRDIVWEIGELPEACADPTFISVAVYNLLSNAVKYSAGRERAIIRVIGERNATETIYHVEDNGVGFNMQYAHKLFGVFQRLHRMEDFQGTGIGLANVRRIVERHGGRVWAHATPDQGATFSFSLPRHPHADIPPC